MSAFIVSPETMQRCVAAMEREDGSWEDACDLGRRLYDLNQRAVQHRYPNYKPDQLPGSPIPENWEFRVTCPLSDGHGIPTNQAIACNWLKALHCLRYQCTEGDEVPNDLLYKQLHDRIRKIERHLVSELPAYQDAPWDG